MVHQVRVIAGRGRGKRIGFPTINMEIPEGLGATHGIYAGWIYINEKKYEAAVHYGPVPTFSETVATLEAYLIDGVVEARGEVGVELVAHMRDIKLFLSADELAQAIRDDVADVRKILKVHRA